MVIYYKLHLNLTNSFYVPKKWVYEKSSLHSRYVWASIHCLMCSQIKDISILEKSRCRINYKPKLQQNVCQNVTYSLHGMHLSIPSRECQPPFWASWSPGTAPLLSDCLLLEQSSKSPAMMTQTIPPELCKAWSMASALISVHDILIALQSLHTSVWCLHAYTHW